MTSGCTKKSVRFYERDLRFEIDIVDKVGHSYGTIRTTPHDHGSRCGEVGVARRHCQTSGIVENR